MSVSSMTPIVVDVGKHSVRVGWSGHDQPKIVVDRKDPETVLPEDLFELIYSRLTRNPSSSHPVIATIPVGASPDLKKIYYEKFMEEWQVPAMFLADTAVVSLFAVGQTSGQCVDMGATHTTVAQVHQGKTTSFTDIDGILAVPTLLTGGKSMGEEGKIKGAPVFHFQSVTNRFHSGFVGASLLSSLSSFSNLFTREMYNEQG